VLDEPDTENEVDDYESLIWPRRYLLIAEAKDGDLVAELRRRRTMEAAELFPIPEHADPREGQTYARGFVAGVNAPSGAASGAQSVTGSPAGRRSRC